MKLKGGKVRTSEVKKFVESSYKDKKTAPKKIGDYILDEKLSNKKVKVYHDPIHDKTVVANRGTANTLADWTNNLKYATDVATGNVFNLYNKSDRFQQAKRTQKQALKKYGKVDTNIGHSQSGVITRKLNEKGLTNQVININPAGFYETPKKNEYSYRSTFDPVSSFTKGTKTASDFILNPIKAHSSEFLNSYHKKYLGGSIDELKQEANDPEIIAKAKDYINNIVDSNYKDYIIKGVEDNLNYDRDEKIIKYIMFKENLKVFDLLYPNQRYLYEDNKPIKKTVPKKEKVIKEKKPPKEKPPKDDTRTPAEKRKATMAKNAQILKAKRIETMKEKAIMIIKKIIDSNYDDSLYPAIKAKIDTYAIPQLVKDTINEIDPRIYKELYPIKKKELSKAEQAALSENKRLTRKEIIQIANEKYKNEMNKINEEKQLKKIISSDINMDNKVDNKKISNNNNMNNKINELLENIKNTNFKKIDNFNKDEINEMINKLELIIKSRKNKKIESPIKNKINELLENIKNTNIKKNDNININQINEIINKIDTTLKEKKVKREKKEMNNKKANDFRRKKLLEKTFNALKVEDKPFEEDKFQDVNNFQLLIYKKKYYLRDLETSEVYSIKKYKPDKRVGIYDYKKNKIYMD
jgi:Txe/YoeB family toxin of Txe-Axe toxin-antitoxin module